MALLYSCRHWALFPRCKGKNRLQRLVRLVLSGEPKRQLRTRSVVLVAASRRYETALLSQTFREVLSHATLPPEAFATRVDRRWAPLGSTSAPNSPFSPVDRSRLLTASFRLGSHRFVSESLLDDCGVVVMQRSGCMTGSPKQSTKGHP